MHDRRRDLVAAGRSVRGDLLQVRADPHQDARRRGAGRRREDLGQPRQHVVDRVGVRDAGGEGRQDLVRRGASSIHDPVRDPPRQPQDRHERHADHDPDQDRDALRGSAPQRDLPQGGHDEERDRTQQDREHQGDQRLLDHDVDVVEPVLQDRDPDRDRDRVDREHDRRLQDVAQRSLGPRDAVHQQVRNEHRDDEAGAGGEPLHLLVLVAGAPAEPDHEGRKSGHEEQEEERHADARDLGRAGDADRVGDAFEHEGVRRERVADDRRRRPGGADRDPDPPATGKGSPVGEQRQDQRAQAEGREPDPVLADRGETCEHRGGSVAGYGPDRVSVGELLEPRPEPGREGEPPDRVARPLRRQHESEDRQFDREHGRESARPEALPGEGNVARRHRVDGTDRRHDDGDDRERPREATASSIGHGGAGPTGSVPATAVPAPGEDRTVSAPPSAASRSAMPCKPVP